MSEIVLYSCSDRIATITMNRPEKRNALNDTMVAALKAAFQKAIADADCKIILLAAAGESFCAGADLDYLRGLQSNTFEENLADSRSLKDLFQLIHRCPKVVIAAIQGHAIAGGCGLATVCDYSFSVPEAKFGYTEVNIGFIPAIVMVYLIRKIGEGRSRELLLGGHLISAETAASYGLINNVVPAQQLMDYAQQLAMRLTVGASAQSLALVKEMIADCQHLPLEEALEYAASMNAKARGTDDCKKGIAAFLNKEKITW